MTLLTLTLTVLLQRNTCLFLSAAAVYFSNTEYAKSSILFSCIKHQPQAWWSAEVEKAVSERCKTFAAAHRNDEDRQVYISAS